MTKRRRLLAGNWKMNKSSAEVRAFFPTFLKESGLEQGNSSIDLAFAVPYLFLTTARECVQASGITIAAQNFHWEPAGAYTGEVSVPMLLDIGIQASLIGHSERRQYFGETDETVNRKVKAALAADLLPIVCVGETLAEWEAKQTEAVVKRQVIAALTGVADVKNLVIAYEPVWAIGTGKSATAKDAQTVHAFIRGVVKSVCGSEAADAMRILYGGSASPANIEELLTMPDIDGGLVGGASLKPSDFAKMTTLAAAAR